MSSLANYLSLSKVALLTLVVMGSFLFSTIAWRRIESEEHQRIIVGAVILVFMYALMVFELINRNLAALIGAAASVAAYDCLVDRVEMDEIIQWQDLETLALLFGMMTMVNVLGASGVFHYLAIWSYRKSNGQFWLLIIIMSFITAFLSAFIDNVSTMLLISPTLIKLSELEHIDPRYVLMIMVLFCNIGGSATPVGDPPNLIVIGDPLVQRLDINFGSFTGYCGPCVLITMVAGLVCLRLMYKSKESFRMDDYIPGHYNQNPNINFELQTAGKHCSIKELNADLVALDQIGELITRHANSGQTIRNLQEQVENQMHLTKSLLEQTRKNPLQQQQQQQLSIELRSGREQRRGSSLTPDEIGQLMRIYSIKDSTILWQSTIVLVLAVLLFFCQPIPSFHLTLGWISLFSALTLLVLTSSVRLPKHEIDEDASQISITQQEQQQQQQADGEEEEEGESRELFDFVIENIEWSTLMFFFSLFIVMEVMAKLGLISFLGKQITLLIDQLPDGDLRLIGAITIVLWTSGLASACIDNVPFTSMMIKVLGTMVIDQETRSLDGDSISTMSIKPIVFALVFGACYGGNGSIIGASANLVTAGISGRHGYPITFAGFFEFAMPITLLSLVIANVYLVLVFVVFGL